MKGLSWRWTGVLLAAVTALTVAAVLVTAGPPAAAPVANRSATEPAAGNPATGADARHPAAARGYAVGALFIRQHGDLGQHFCTASVVASPAGNLVITAAHCVTGVSLAQPGGIVFAPGYARGRFPRGLWEVTRKFVDSRWAANQDPNDDVAFLEVKKLSAAQAPAGQAASATSVQRAAGAERLRFGTALPVQIRAIGYPDASNSPVACSTRAVAFRPGSLDQVMFVCPGFTDGTSGGPFLSEFSLASGAGAIIGVIGGYQQGGDSPDISYSSAFNANVRALYLHAEQASRA